MTSTKVLLVVLILMVVLFVVFIASGPSRSDPNSPPPAALQALNGVMAPFSVKLKAQDLQPPVAVFDLQSAPHYSAKILPDSDHKFRQAKFTVRPNKTCMRITFEAVGPIPEHMSRTQRLPDDSDQEKTSTEFTFTIFSGGGTLTVDRASTFASPCKITLQ